MEKKQDQAEKHSSIRPHAKSTPQSIRITHPIVVMGGITVLILGACEIMERTWMRGWDSNALEAFRITRTIAYFLIAATGVSWMILRKSRAFWPADSAEENISEPLRMPQGERNKLYARWFIAMRWLVVLVAGSLVLIAVRSVGLLSEEASLPLALTVGVLAGINLLYMLLIRWNRGASLLLVLQGYLDLLVLTALLHFSGGVENPLSTVMVFHVIIGGILLSRRQCYGIATAGALLFAFLIWAEYAGIVEHYTLLVFPHSEYREEFSHVAHQPIYAISRAVLQMVVLFLTAYFVTTLAERLRWNEQRFELMANRATADRKLLERALETTGTGLRVLTKDLRPHWHNNLWNEWFQPTSLADASVVAPLNDDQSSARKILLDGQTRETELILDPPESSGKTGRSDGGRRMFRITTAALLNTDGKVDQVVELAQDVTRHIRTQAQMMRAGRLAAVGELAGQVAHEVNNPIAIISAKAHLLLSDRRDEMSPKIIQEIAKIEDLANRVARISQALLSYCRPPAGARVRLDIRIPIRKSLAMIEQHAQRNGVAIIDHLDDPLPPIQGNAGELEQVFINLFLNALDAMPDGGQLEVSSTAVSVPLRTGRPGLAIMVQDSGIGIPETLREQVFEPFFTTKKEGRGTGLGLSICMGLIESHDGELDIENSPAGGARLIVKLPIDSIIGKKEASNV